MFTCEHSNEHRYDKKCHRENINMHPHCFIVVKSGHAAPMCFMHVCSCVCILPRDRVRRSQRAAILYGLRATGKPSAVR